MEILSKISCNFDNVKKALKEKSSSGALCNFTKSIQALSTDLAALARQDSEWFYRALAMEGHLALLSAKTLPVTLPEKINMLRVIFEKLKPHFSRAECLFIFLRIQNLLCYYLIRVEQISLARNILENAETFHDQLEKETSSYYDSEDLFTIEPMDKIEPLNPEKIDKIITNNIQMQAFIYNRLQMTKKYTIYSHAALRRLLQAADGCPREWAANAALLGARLIELREVADARHHLMAAYYVLRACKRSSTLVPETLYKQTDFELSFLELGHYWVKYGLMLFELSKKKLLNQVFNEDTVQDISWSVVDETESMISEINEDPAKREETLSDVKSVLIFPQLDLAELEDKVPLKLVSTIEEARKLFAFTNKWLMKVRKHYDVERHSAQYISCSLQLAELYEHLAFFEKCLEDQYSIQRKRAEVLENLNCLLRNCDNVLPAQVDVLRELSQVQLEMMALNLRRLWRDESQLTLSGSEVPNSTSSDTERTLMETNLNRSSKSVFLRKMEAATSINGKLFRLCSELERPTSSLSTFDTVTL